MRERGRRERRMKGTEMNKREIEEEDREGNMRKEE